VSRSSHDEDHLPFWEHLEVLRWHVIRSLVAILSIAFVAFSAREFVFHTLVLGPARPNFWTYRVLCRLGEWICSPALCIQELPFTLQSRQLAGQFTVHVLSSLVLGLMGAFPYVLWELWCFVKPSISPMKRTIIYSSILVVSLLFMLGVFFGYYIVTPLIIHFLANYQVDPSIVNRFDIVSYVSTIVTLTLACAFMFQLPVVVYFLARVGIITAHNMRAYRRHAIVATLILAAIITPPDVMSQILIAIPLVLLYESSILIAQFLDNKKRMR
jgi:sec-independent protein translocase protein TatC